MIELKPCPFCGYKKPEFFDCGSPGDFEDWAVDCPNCGVLVMAPGEEPGCVATKEEVAKAWNRRAPNGQK